MTPIQFNNGNSTLVNHNQNLTNNSIDQSPIVNVKKEEIIYNDFNLADNSANFLGANVANNANISPTSAAISTAAAVAAIGSGCFDVPTAPPMNHGNSSSQQQSLDKSISNSRANSTTASHCTTPSSTPGPLAPPPGKLLPENQLELSHHNTNNNHYNSNNINNIFNVQNHDQNLLSKNMSSVTQLYNSSQAPQQRGRPGALLSPKPNDFATIYSHHNGYPITTTNSTSSIFHPRQMQMNSLPFGNSPKRRGKWTPEEEHYANALIEEFEKGTIIDCENGCTLRSYLSRKLNCAPMRISKKYAGKSIGKHVFLSRMSSLANQHGLCSTNNALGLNNNDINKIPPATQANLQKLRDLEFRFHMSLLQEGTPCGLRQSLGNEQKGHLNKITGSYKSVNKTLPVIYPSPSLNNPVGKTIGSTTTVSSQVTTTPLPQNLASSMSSTTFQWFPPMSTDSINQSQEISGTRNMKESLLNAYREATSSSSLPSNESISNSNHPNLIVPQDKLEPNPDNETKSEANRSSEEFTNSGESGTDSHSLSIGQAQQNWLSETMQIIPTLDPSNYMAQYSPTYTSKSFDDLHQFIGNDYPLSVVATMKAPKESTDDEIRGPATDVANLMNIPNNNIKNSSVADAYALFAQQSATAMSKHSAYAHPCDNNSNSDEERNSSTLIIGNPIIRGNSSNSSVMFNATNLQLHSAAVAEKERADKASKDSLESKRVSSSTGILVPVSKDTPSSKFDTSSILTHSNIVSGSDRSSSDTGNENSSAGGSGEGLSGSDNASDNSDSASDEGQRSSSGSGSSKRRNNENKEKENSSKRQKLEIHSEINTLMQ